jgi:hypothetical protein
MKTSIFFLPFKNTPFAGRIQADSPEKKYSTLIVALDPDVAKVFATSESVNHALRAIITAMPK